MSSVHFEVSGAVAVLRLDNPPVNSLGHELRRSIVEALARAEDDRDVQAVVLIGSGKGFSGGADIREFGTPKALAAPNLRPRQELDGRLQHNIRATLGAHAVRHAVMRSGVDLGKSS